MGGIGDVALLVAVVACCLFITVVDIHERRIPNSAVCALAVLSVVQGSLVLAGHDLLLGLPPLSERLVWAFGALTVMLVFEALWRVLHDGTHGMGMGDVKLIGVMFLWLGVTGLPCVCAACAIAAVVNLLRGEKTFAFGPYLTLALLSGIALLAFAGA